MRLSVALAAPALDEDGCEQQFHSLLRSEARPVRRAPIYIAAALRKTDRFCGALQRLSRTRRLQEQPAFYLWKEFEQFCGIGLIARVFTQDQIWPKQSRGQPIKTQELCQRRMNHNPTACGG